jgi:hypothetical protein
VGTSGESMYLGLKRAWQHSAGGTATVNFGTFAGMEGCVGILQSWGPMKANDVE